MCVRACVCAQIPLHQGAMGGSVICDLIFPGHAHSFYFVIYFLGWKE